MKEIEVKILNVDIENLSSWNLDKSKICNNRELEVIDTYWVNSLNHKVRVRGYYSADISDAY